MCLSVCLSVCWQISPTVVPSCSHYPRLPLSSRSILSLMLLLSHLFGGLSPGSLGVHPMARARLGWMGLGELVSMGKAQGNCCLQCYLLRLPWRSWQDWKGAGAGRSWNSSKMVGTSMEEMGGQPFHAKRLVAAPAGSVFPLYPQPALSGLPTKLNCPLTPNGPLGQVSGKSSSPHQTPGGKGSLAQGGQQELRPGATQPPWPIGGRGAALLSQFTEVDMASLAGDGYPKKLPYSIKVGHARGFTWALLHTVHLAERPAGCLPLASKILG